MALLVGLTGEAHPCREGSEKNGPGLAAVGSGGKLAEKELAGAS